MTEPGRLPAAKRARVVAVLATAGLLAVAAQFVTVGDARDLVDGVAGGLALGAVLVALVGLRAGLRGGGVSSAERLMSGQADERDIAIKRAALATLGYWCLPLTGIAALAVVLGAPAQPVMTVLLGALLLLLALSYVVAAHRL